MYISRIFLALGDSHFGSAADVSLKACSRSCAKVFVFFIFWKYPFVVPFGKVLPHPPHIIQKYGLQHWLLFVWRSHFFGEVLEDSLKIYLTSPNCTFSPGAKQFFIFSLVIIAGLAFRVIHVLNGLLKPVINIFVCHTDLFEVLTIVFCQCSHFGGKDLFKNHLLNTLQFSAAQNPKF